jgi:hypothetical protein
MSSLSPGMPLIVGQPVELPPEGAVASYNRATQGAIRAGLAVPSGSAPPPLSPLPLVTRRSNQWSLTGSSLTDFTPDLAGPPGDPFPTRLRSPRAASALEILNCLEFWNLCKLAVFTRLAITVAPKVHRI